MTTSGTYTFNPSIGDLTLEAFERIGLEPNQLTARHMISARMSANLELQSWALRGVNLWAVDLQTVNLTDEDDTYTLDTATQAILDAYVTIDGIDYPLTPMSRTDYANIARKDDGGRPTQYWFERIVLPQVTFWRVPDADDTYVFKFYRLRRLQDSEYANGQTADIHYRFTDAFAAGLCARLAEKYAPEKYNDKLVGAGIAWKLAAAEDREMVPLTIMPQIGGYFT